MSMPQVHPTPASKRVVLLIYSLGGGGAERVSAILMNRWVQAGHQVTLLTMSGTGEESYPLHGDVQRVALGLDQISTSSVGAVFNNLRRLWRLRRTLRALRPDVTLAMMSTSAILLGLASTSKSGLLLGSERSHPPALPLGRIWEWLRRRAYGRLDAVVAQTEPSAQWIREHTRARHVVVIHNPLDWPLPRQSPELLPTSQLAVDRRVVLAVGRLAREKQFEHAIQAFARLAKDFSEWDLVILGEGPKRAELEALVQRLSLEGRVHLPGRVGNLADWYARADLYVMTSLYEGFPNTLMEALASGLPCISYDCDTGPRDLIRPGVDGEVIPPQDLEQLTRSMSGLMADHAPRAAMGAQASQTRDRFSMARVGAEWDALLNLPGRPA